MSRKPAGQTKGERRAEKRQRRQKGNLSNGGTEASRPRQRRASQPVEPMTKAQSQYINAIENNKLTFSRGPAGTGKTYIPASIAAEMFDANEIRKIIITRPAVGAEEEYGFFPGDLDEKVAPWAAPVIAILEERLGTGAVEYMLKAKQIEVAPLGMLRGHTFKDAFIIFDEAQNATKNQMKLFLTRIGENVKVVVDGDPDDQLDLKDSRGKLLPSGFEHAWKLMQNLPNSAFVTFTLDDIVRSGIARDILLRYHNERSEDKGIVGEEQLRKFLQ